METRKLGEGSLLRIPPAINEYFQVLCGSPRLPENTSQGATAHYLRSSALWSSISINITYSLLNANKYDMIDHCNVPSLTSKWKQYAVDYSRTYKDGGAVETLIIFYGIILRCLGGDTVLSEIHRYRACKPFHLQILGSYKTYLKG